MRLDLLGKEAGRSGEELTVDFESSLVGPDEDADLFEFLETGGAC